MIERIRRFFFVALTLFAASCGFKTEISPTELEWINIYHAGDSQVLTLIDASLIRPLL